MMQGDQVFSVTVSVSRRPSRMPAAVRFRVTSDMAMDASPFPPGQWNSTA